MQTWILVLKETKVHCRVAGVYLVMAGSSVRQQRFPKGRAEPPINLARVGGVHCWEQRVSSNVMEAGTRF